MATMPMTPRVPITNENIVTIRGRHLYTIGTTGTSSQSQQQRKRRFYMTGIAFPTPPPSQPQTATATATAASAAHDDNIDDMDSPPSTIAARRNPILDKLLHNRRDDGNNNDDRTIDTDNNYGPQALNLTGWNAILDQLSTQTPTLNTVRLYEMDCRRAYNHDYDAFLTHAAQLGIYVLVPLTTRTGGGVLSRDLPAPQCYPRQLYEYATSCLDAYWDHPNVLAGVVGNEVMNSLDSWQAAPCVRAFLDDMAKYGRHKASMVRKRGGNNGGGGTRTEPMPLLYATQHDSPSAEFSTDDAMKLTLDYLTCRDADEEVDADAPANTANTATRSGHGNNAAAGEVSVSSSHHHSPFIFGINIESWCSSLQTFEYEEDGLTESSYHSLWNAMRGGNLTQTTLDAITGVKTTVEIPRTISPLPASVPIVFSEMGCSRYSFNKDNDVTPKMIRDWKQIPLVSEGGPMADVFSGFVAYGYDGGGNKYFRMMGGTDKWDGIHPLSLDSEDYQNFRLQLGEAAANKTSTTLMNDVAVDEHRRSGGAFPSCKDTLESIRTVWDVELRRQRRMPSYFDRDHRHWFPWLPSSNKHASTSQQLKLEEISLGRDSIDDSSFVYWGASSLMALVVVVPVLIFTVKPNVIPPTRWTPAERREEGISDNLSTLNEESTLLGTTERQPKYTYVR